jgi:hypothetical protein
MVNIYARLGDIKYYSQSLGNRDEIKKKEKERKKNVFATPVHDDIDLSKMIYQIFWLVAIRGII